MKHRTALHATDMRIDEVIALARSAAQRSAAPRPATDDDPVELARTALVQRGFSSATANQAVERATAHVGTPAELAGLIKETLRC